MTHDKVDTTQKLWREACALVNQGYYKEAIPKLQKCLEMLDDPVKKRLVMCEIGVCCSMLHWHNEAVQIYSEYLKDFPFDNDARFFLASAYGSMKWTDESIEELKKIIELDPTDVLAYHDLGLCYKDKGWYNEALETLTYAKENAMVFGNQEERKIIEKTLANLEKDIGEGDKNKLKIIILLAMLLMLQKKKR